MSLHMCNRYVSLAAGDMERYWHVGARSPWRAVEVFPRAPGRSFGPAATAERGRELVIGQWGLIPWFAKAAKLAYSTSNAVQRGTQHEGVVRALVAVRQALHHSGHVLRRAELGDGQEHLLAPSARRRLALGTDRAVEHLDRQSHWRDGRELHHVTLNAHEHPVMSRMHKPDPQFGPEAQDKRSVVPIELEDMDAWLHGTQEQAQALVRLAPVEAFDAGPVGG